MPVLMSLVGALCLRRRLTAARRPASAQVSYVPGEKGSYTDAAYCHSGDVKLQRVHITDGTLCHISRIVLHSLVEDRAVRRTRTAAAPFQKLYMVALLCR